MFAANTYRVRIATDEDNDTLNRLAAHRALRPLEGTVLIGERNGAPAAALSLADGRVIADDYAGTDHLIANLRVRAIAIWSHEPDAPQPACAQRLRTSRGRVSTKRGISEREWSSASRRAVAASAAIVSPCPTSSISG